MLVSLMKSSPFYQQLQSSIAQYGGIFNAHLHLDRAGTIEPKYFQATGIETGENSSISLAQKHSLIATLHNGLAYDLQDLENRVNYYLDSMVAVNTFRADTVVDVSLDRVGLSAIKLMNKIKHRRAKEIDLRIGAYSPLGFTDTEPERWDLLVEATQLADFIGALPERDDQTDYPSHIGFYEHCKRMLLLAQQVKKSVHFHLDQRNEPSENGTEILLNALDKVGAPNSETGEPMIWGIHVISPSTYQEDRFNRLLERLVEHNVGVVCCPSAAISMRQLRPIYTSTYNSIARLLEMLAVGIHVRLGSDNIADICSPSSTPDLTDEIFVLSNTLRFYNVEILAKLSSGVLLNQDDRQLIKQHLKNNDLEIQKILDRIDKNNQK
jgi:cytosine/adenosine deaminase-related metal-dependent hydrolase